MSQIKGVCTLSELKKLEVINLCDGKRLGTVCDLEMDLCLGCITAIIIPKQIDIFHCFKKGVNRFFRIPWCNIERIGDDTILVRWENCD